MWKLGDKELSSRLLLGTAQYSSLEIMEQAIAASAAEVITLGLKRQTPKQKGGEAFWEAIKKLNRILLPNTAGCRTAKEAVSMAHIARELFETNWIKLEVFGDEHNLQPDPFELLQAARILNQAGFEVFPYCTEDLILCQRLVDCGCRILMPWAAPIGTGKGLIHLAALENLRRRLPQITLIIDAGIGKPSHAAQAMEIGFDGVLLNTAVALALDPVGMAHAFREAIQAGRNGYKAGLMPERETAHPSTLLIETPFW